MDTGIDADYVKHLEEALRACQRSIGQLRTALLVVEGQLSKPFPDDPRWSPWTRFIERPWKAAAAASELARAALKANSQGEERSTTEGSTTERSGS